LDLIFYFLNLQNDRKCKWTQISIQLFNYFLKLHLQESPIVRTQVFIMSSWPSRKLPFECQKIAKNVTFFPKKCQKLSFFFQKIAIGNLTFKWQFSGGSDVKLSLLSVFLMKWFWFVATCARTNEDEIPMWHKQN